MKQSLPRISGWLLSCLLFLLLYNWLARPGLAWWPGYCTHGNPAVRSVALTFDDGPHPLWAPLLADTLERNHARGTFFLVGMQAQEYPELVARLLRGGHQIGNHSMTHPYPNLTILPPAKIAAEIRVPAVLLTKMTGHPVRYFRPPGGGVDRTVAQVVKDSGFRLAWWSRNIGDATAAPLEPALIRQRLQAAQRPGLVALLHERERTVAGLEQFFAAEKKSSYRYATYDEVVGVIP